MDWMPLLVGLLAGTGDSLIGKYAAGTGTIGRHKYLLYRAGLFGAGLYGEWSGKLSPDLSYGLMVSGASLIAQDVPDALSGEGFRAFGAVYPAGQGGPAPTYDPNAPWPSSPHLTVPSAAGAVYSTGREGIYSSTPGITEPTVAGALHYDHNEVERTLQATRSYTPVGAAG